MPYQHSPPYTPTLADQAAYDPIRDTSADGYSHADAYTDAMRQLPHEYAPAYVSAACHASTVSYPSANGYKNAPPRHSYCYSKSRWRLGFEKGQK